MTEHPGRDVTSEPARRRPSRAQLAFAAVDLGATSGRVMVGRVGPESPGPHGGAPVPQHAGPPPGRAALGRARALPGRPRRAARGRAGRSSVGIDSWAVDYGLLDADGALLGNPVPLPRHPHRRRRRDRRCGPRSARSRAVPVTGLQHLPFNTVFQLAAARATRPARRRRTLLLIPDLLTYWLTGRHRRGGHQRLHHRAVRRPHRRPGRATSLDRPRHRPEAARRRCAQPGDPAGTLLPARRRRHRARRPDTAVTTVASHDTASAVVAVPATDTGLRLHLLRHLVAGRPRTRRAGAQRGEPRRELHQRAAASTAPSAICATSWACGCSRSAAVPGRRRVCRTTCPPCSPAPPRPSRFASVVDPDDAGVPGTRATCPRASPTYCRRTGPAGPRSQGAVVRCILESPGPGPPPHPAPGAAARRPRRSTSSTWSAAAPATNCCASSPPTPPASR